MLIPLERNLSPEQVDARLRQAHRSRRTAERALAFYLKEVNDRRLHEAFGYASIRHYSSLRNIDGRSGVEWVC